MSIFKGIQKTSLIDHPGYITSIVFTYGCNFYCHYCHNKSLVTEKHKSLKPITYEEIFSLFEERKNFTESISISGGEPLIHFNKLYDFLKEFRKRFPEKLIKLDTNGSFPNELEILIKESLIDGTSMDIKTGLSGYHNFTNIPDITDKILHSVSILKTYKNIYREYRTTVLRLFFKDTDIKEINDYILSDGDIYNLQQVTIDKELNLDYNFLSKYKLEELRYSFDEIKDLTQKNITKKVKLNFRSF